MKFLHTADLHIGKHVNEFDMLEEQENILAQISHIAVQNHVDALIVAGDIYDRSVPPAEAVKLFDRFISNIIKENIRVFIISGNHDSPERLSFANAILEKQGLVIEGRFNGETKAVELKDDYGTVTFHLLPFMKPANVENIYNKKNLSYDESVREVIDHMEMGADRNVLITHHFVVGTGIFTQTCDSEISSVGGSDQVDVSCFKEFDYTALGHLHRGYQLGTHNVYYAGSPLKYSFSEVKHTKGVNLVTMLEKGNINVEWIELKPINDMRIIKGPLEQLMDLVVVEAANPNDYIKAVLTDEEELLNPIGVLRNVYPNIMEVRFSKEDKLLNGQSDELKKLKNKSTYEIYKEFFEFVTERELDEEREKMIKDLIEKAKEDCDL